MNIAVIGTSRKEHETRRPIHPAHLDKIPVGIRNHLYFERSYGEPFGMSDDEIRDLTGNNVLERGELLHDFKSILITKPVIEDFEEVQDGSSVWGWLHSVQQRQITQLGIEKKLTLIAWENMYHSSDRELIHIFYRNNELAGYCGVQHALQCMGLDGNYGPPLSAAVICFGSVSRGAIYALQAHGVHNITVFTQRSPALISNRLPGLIFKQFRCAYSGVPEIIQPDGKLSPMLDELTAFDLIVNGILQNPTDPILLIRSEDSSKFSSPCLIIDVSCSRCMGFDFARPTTIYDPIFSVGKIEYYGVDHTPALLWNSATWEISNALLPYISFMVDEKENYTIINATDMKDGVILNNDILLYQNRSSHYPHKEL